MILNQEGFFGTDMPAALLILGGTAMSFHYHTLRKFMRGVPVTMALGDPVSGKSSAVEAGMSLFNVRESVGAGSEAKLFETLGSTTIPVWWDDIDSIPILERLTVLLYNRSKKVTMSKDVKGTTLPIITSNYTKIIKGLKKMNAGPEDAERLFTRLLPIPFAKKTQKRQDLKSRMAGRGNFESIIVKTPRSVGVVLKLKKDYDQMLNDELFQQIASVLKEIDIDVRSEENFAVLLYSTGKILQHISLYERYFDDIVKFTTSILIPTYHQLTSGKLLSSTTGNVMQFHDVTKTSTSIFQSALQQIITRAEENAEEAKSYINMDVKTKNCNCGSSIALNVPKAVTVANLEISDATFRNLLKEIDVGCTHKKLKLPSGQVVTAVHVSHRKLLEKGITLEFKVEQSTCGHIPGDNDTSDKTEKELQMSNHNDEVGYLADGDNVSDCLVGRYGRGEVSEEQCSKCGTWVQGLHSAGVHVAQSGTIQVYSDPDIFECPHCPFTDLEPVEQSKTSLSAGTTFSTCGHIPGDNDTSDNQVELSISPEVACEEVVIGRNDDNFSDNQVEMSISPEVAGEEVVIGRNDDNFSDSQVDLSISPEVVCEEVVMGRNDDNFSANKKTSRKRKCATDFGLSDHLDKVFQPQQEKRARKPLKKYSCV